MTEVPTIGEPFTVPTGHWHRLDDGRIQCDVCPRSCRLNETAGRVLCPHGRGER